LAVANWKIRKAESRGQQSPKLQIDAAINYQSSIIKYQLIKVSELFKDKNSCYSLREITVAILLLALLASWIATQFFGKPMPEYMFYSFSSMIAAGCFGYSLEKKNG
jgi:hypothetical protein